MGKKLETVKLVASLEKAARKTKKVFWLDLAERLSKPSRGRVEVNLDQLNGLAAKFKGKTIVVPGKVLARGELLEKASVVAVSASAQARKKIMQKGSFVTLSEYAQAAKETDAAKAVIAG